MSAIRELAGTVRAATPADRAHFFGFFDLCPWSYGNDRLVVLACDGELRRTPSGEAADVCIWDPDSGTIKPIARTVGWNFQHGARTQWLRDGTVLFNDVVDGRQCARIVDSDGTEQRMLQDSIAALHPDESFGVTPNYSRLADYYPAYGYHVAENRHLSRLDEEADGLWRVDFASGRSSLLLSFGALCKRLGVRYSPRMFVTHPVFSRSGSKLCFFFIDEREGGSHFMWLIAYDVRSDEINVVNGDKNSHATWLDDDRIMVWSRCSSAINLVRRSSIHFLPGVKSLARLVRRWQGVGRNLALSEGFHVFDTAGANRRKLIAPSLIPEDGHPSKHPTRNIVLCDTYPDASGVLTLFLYSLDKNERIDVARVEHGVKTSNIDLRCDLHPRWDRTGECVSVDYAESGVRRTAIIDVRQALEELR